MSESNEPVESHNGTVGAAAAVTAHTGRAPLTLKETEEPSPNQAQDSEAKRLRNLMTALSVSAAASVASIPASSSIAQRCEHDSLSVVFALCESLRVVAAAAQTCRSCGELLPSFVRAAAALGCIWGATLSV
jgi:hypothetical protein